MISKYVKVIQEVTITKNGLCVFKNVPAGTFYLKEKAPLIRIESTKDGIKAYDKDNQQLDETTVSTNNPKQRYLLIL